MVPIAEPPPRTGNYGPETPPPPIGTTPLSTVLVVDPLGTGIVRDGAFSGAQAFRTLQEAYNTLPNNTSAAIWCGPGSVGPLVIPPTTVGQSLSVVGFGSPFGGRIFVDSVSIQSTARLFFEFAGVIVQGQILDTSIGQGFIGNVVLRNVEVDDTINVPSAIVETFDASSLSGAQLRAAQLLSQNAQRLPALINAGLLQWDATSERTCFGGSGVTATTLPAGQVLHRIDDGMQTGVVANDANQTFADNVRAVVQPGFITAPRTYELDHTNGTVAGAVVDVWTQGFDVTIVDQAVTTLLVVPANSAPIRLFFFGSPVPANFVLSGAQSLAT